MKIFWYILAGVSGGLLGGMGMGGGTLLIPILTVFLEIGQKEAQAINLISFIPMAIVALIIHVKNKLVDKKRLLWQILPASAATAPSALLAAKSPAATLRRCFGIFLIVLGAVSLIVYSVKYLKEARLKKKLWQIPKNDKKSPDSTRKPLI